MSADTVHPLRTVRTATPRSLLGWSFAANALVQFAIQAWLAFSFAAHVWHLPGFLPFAAPAALDAFVVNMMIVTYELRTSRMRTRVYAWTVLALGIALQVGAAEGFAMEQHWGWAARIASFAPALLLAASLHTLIIRRRVESDSDGQGRAEQADADAALIAADADFHRATVAEQAAGRAPVTARPPRLAIAPAAPPVSSGRRPAVVKATDAAAVAEVRDLVAAGVSCRDAARKLGKSKRWAEGHTKDIRAGRSTQRDQPAGEMHGAAIAGEGASSLKGEDAQVSEMQSDLAPEPGQPDDLESA